MKITPIIFALLFLPSFAFTQTKTPIPVVENRLEKSQDDIDLCFLPVEIVNGAEVHIIHDAGLSTHKEYTAFSGLWEFNLTVSNTGKPIVLILRSNHDMAWKLNIDDDASVVGVHLIADELPRIDGLPENIPVTARYNLSEDDARNNCVFSAVVDPALSDFGAQQLRGAKKAFNKLNGVITLDIFDDNLSEYAGASITSYQRTYDGVAMISETSAQTFEETKALGRTLLEQATPRDLSILNDGVARLKVPEGLGRGKVWPWIISEGYASKSTLELVRHLCEQDRLIAMASGVVDSRGQCRWGDIRHAATWYGLLLLGPVWMSEETCRLTSQPMPLFAKSGMNITTEGSNCSIYTFDISRKTFRW